jgi:branched-chain amino acid aminotransferase
MNRVCLDGKMIAGDEPALMADNRGFRYGDALFETMKLINGKIVLGQYHFERLFSGLQLLKFEIPVLLTPEKINLDILHLCKQNKSENLARVRLTVFRGNGGLYDEAKNPQYLIECWPLNESVNRLNENGLIIDIFPEARKSCDKFSNLKSVNYLPYTMAAIYAKENKLNDCLVLNEYERICDASIANIFWIKNEKIYTPALSEGCIAGVMRKYLLAKLQGAGFTIQELPCTIEMLENADEVFLTNAINGIRWVSRFREKEYPYSQAEHLFAGFIRPLYQKLIE